MTTLRQRAEQAARELSVSITNFVGGDWHDDDVNGIAGDIADAIEREAKRFAEEVLRDAMADWSLLRYDNFNGIDVDNYVVAAIEAAERDQT